MAFTKEGSKWWRGFLGTSPNRDLAATEILRQQYVEEMQGIGQLPQHAYKMQYPQFREKLLHIAADKSKHAEWITEKIAALGGKLPDVPERRSTDANSWQSLLMALDDKNRSADRLPQQLRRIGLEHPDITTYSCKKFPTSRKSLAIKSERG